MCGRFTLHQSADTIAEVFDLDDMPVLEPRYNIAPTQPIAAIRIDPASHDRQFTYLYWGLIPSWAKDPSIGNRLINARAETLAEKPSFRTAFKRRRCLIVADGFYEWQRSESKSGTKKQPFYFQRHDRQPFAFAGLWEHWESAEGFVQSGTIITTTANDVLRPIHDRMPVMLQPEDYQQWLDPTIQDGDRLQALLQPYAAAEMISYPVSLTVNNPRNDRADCLEPLTEELTEELTEDQ